MYEKKEAGKAFGGMQKYNLSHAKSQWRQGTKIQASKKNFRHANKTTSGRKIKQLEEFKT